jgi:hypothetical protein
MVENQYGMCVVPPPTFSVAPAVSAYTLCNAACDGPSGNTSSLAPGWNVSSCTGSWEVASCTANLQWQWNGAGSDTISSIYPQICSNTGGYGIQMAVNQSGSFSPQISIQSSMNFQPIFQNQPDKYVLYPSSSSNVAVCPSGMEYGELDPNNPNSWNMANLFDSTFYKQNLTDTDKTAIPFSSLYGFANRNTNYASYLPNLFS